MAGIAENLSNPVTAQRTMGVDLNKEVSDRVKTYRSNPKKLQERYQMSQELLDLLALQQIKSEQSAVANDMKLKQAAMNPEASMTTKEKLTQNVVGTKTQEMASQIGGAYANMNKKRKAAMSKFATNAARRPAGIAAAMPKPVNKNQGLGALQGTTLAAKSGGIMPKFKVGTYVPTAEEIKAEIARLNAVNNPNLTKGNPIETAKQSLLEKRRREDALNIEVPGIVTPKLEKTDGSYSDVLKNKLINDADVKKTLGADGVGDFFTDAMSKEVDANKIRDEISKYYSMSPEQQKLMSGERDRIMKDLADYQAETKRLYSPEAEAERRRTTALRGLTLGGLGGVSQALQRLDSKEGTSRAARGAVRRGLSQELFNLNNAAVRDAMGVKRSIYEAGETAINKAISQKTNAAAIKLGINKEVFANMSKNAQYFIAGDYKDKDAAIQRAQTLFNAALSINLGEAGNKLKAEIAEQTAEIQLEQISSNAELKKQYQETNDINTLMQLRTSAQQISVNSVAKLTAARTSGIQELTVASSVLDKTTKPTLKEMQQSIKTFSENYQKLIDNADAQGKSAISSINNRLSSFGVNAGSQSSGFSNFRQVSP